MNIEMTPPVDADCLWVAGDRIRFVGGVSGSKLELVEIDVSAGSGMPPHAHESPKLLYILEGELTLRQFGADARPLVMRAKQGTSVRIPSRAPHTYGNETSKPVRMLALLGPSMIAFFREVGAGERPQGQPDFALIDEAMRRHGIQVLQIAS